MFAGSDLFIWCSVCHRVVPAVTAVFEAVEAGFEVDVALAGDHVDFVFAGVVSKPHLAEVIDSKCIDESVDTFGDKVRVVDGKCPTESAWRYDVEDLFAFLDGVGEVFDLECSGSAL